MTIGFGADSRLGDGIEPTTGPAMTSGLSAHMPTLRSDTSISVVVPCRSRWNRAVPIAPQSVLEPWRSKNAAGWNMGGPPPGGVILWAIEALAQPAARSNPPVSTIGPFAPHPEPQA